MRHGKEAEVIQAEKGRQEQSLREVLEKIRNQGYETAAVLWKPDEKHYGANPREAKLLYVAATRALHELYLLGDEPVSSLTAGEKEKSA